MLLPRRIRKDCGYRKSAQRESLSADMTQSYRRCSKTLPDILVGIVVILVLSASMSTLPSLVHTSSTTLTLDLIKGHIIKKMDDKKQLLCMRILILVFVAISVVIAIFQFMNNATFIAQLMGISVGRTCRSVSCAVYIRSVQ